MDHDRELRVSPWVLGFATNARVRSCTLGRSKGPLTPIAHTQHRLWHTPVAQVSPLYTARMSDESGAVPVPGCLGLCTSLNN